MGKKNCTLINARCSLVPIVAVLRELKTKMTARHWEILERTPFAHFMELEAIIQERGLLDSLLGMYDVKTRTFNIGSTQLEFRAEDVGMILGLRCHGVAVKFKPKAAKTTFECRFLANAADRDRNAIQKVLLDLVVKDKTEEENFIKMLVVYLLGTFLFTTTSCAALQWVASYANNLATLRDYAWAQATHQWLMEEIPDAAGRVKARVAGELTTCGYLRGCVLALNLWFYEVTGTGTKIFFKKIPRIMCYGEKSFKKQKTLYKLLKTVEGMEIELIGGSAQTNPKKNPPPSNRGKKTEEEKLEEEASLKTVVQVEALGGVEDTLALILNKLNTLQSKLDLLSAQLNARHTIQHASSPQQAEEDRPRKNQKSGTYEQGTFCETFHSDDAGWRNCKSCRKHVHCGCIVSNEAYLLLDAGGGESIVSVRKPLASENQTNKNGNGFATPSDTNTENSATESIANTSIRSSKGGSESKSSINAEDQTNQPNFDRTGFIQKDGPGSKASPGPSKRKSSVPGSKNKHLRIENEDSIELNLTWEEAHKLLRPSTNPASNVVVVDGLEIEEFQETPVLGKRTFFSTDHTGEMHQWAQCENCLKWRKLPVDALLPFKWNCSDNTWDKERASCTLPQELSKEEFAALLPTNNGVSKKSKTKVENEAVEVSDGIDTLANLAILGEGEALPSSSLQQSTHGTGQVARIVCIQPGSGKDPKHQQICTCNVCLAAAAIELNIQPEREEESSQPRDLTDIPNSRSCLPSSDTEAETSE